MIYLIKLLFLYLNETFIYRYDSVINYMINVNVHILNLLCNFPIFGMKFKLGLLLIYI